MARGDTLTNITKMVVEECCSCGISFAFPEAFQKECLESPGANGKHFFCPNGHNQFYRGESEAAKLRRERDRLTQQLAQKDDEILTAVRLQAKAEAETKRLKKRTVNGVCPCCTRSFQDLKRHVATKHPEFKQEVTH